MLTPSLTVTTSDVYFSWLAVFLPFNEESVVTVTLTSPVTLNEILPLSTVATSSPDLTTLPSASNNSKV